MSEPTTPITLGGRYEIGDVLGRGGMAEVHAGRDTRLGRQVAVKMLRVDLARDPSFQMRFRREAHSAASLNHPSIAAVYDTGEDVVAGSSVPYIVMEYVDGSTLRDLLSSGRRLLPERALEITAGVLEALDYSHRHGIVHRDIKPANVMLTRSGSVKVMDFGIARSVSDDSQTMTQTSAVVGTAQYLSPEQARGEMVDARSDLYSTGCLLYELLTGRPPFVGDSAVAVAYQHVREQPQPPSTVDPDVTAAADAIALKALTKDRAERYQTAAEMRADIDRALAGRPVEAPAVSATTQRMAPVMAPVETTVVPALVGDEHQPRRRTAAYLLLALAVLAVFVLAGYAGRSLFTGGTSDTQVAVPDVRDLPEAQARSLIEQRHLVFDSKPHSDAKRPKGTVISQSPVEGTQRPEGSTVTVTVSQGPDITTVPQLEGLSRQDALDALQRQHLTAGKTTTKDSVQPKDQVLAASAGPGKEVPVNSTVDVVLATGNNKVPDVAGKSPADAASILKTAGFEPGDQLQTRNTSRAAGTVAKTDPGAGAVRALGSTVLIYVATAPPPPTAPPTPAATPGPSAGATPGT